MSEPYVRIIRRKNKGLQAKPEVVQGVSHNPGAENKATFVASAMEDYRRMMRSWNYEVKLRAELRRGE